jgi:20S proteasome alpha/beta subunit
MRPGMLGSLSAIFLLPLFALAGEKPPDDSIIHRTINIALGNENGLVVLTDSMVTAGTQQLPAPGQKLFRLDDHSVCAIAGFASAPASSGNTEIPDLNTNVSALIREYIRQSALQPAQSIAEKLRALGILLNLRLSAIANIRDALGSTTGINDYRFQLIVAGYDIDRKPKIGTLTLRTKDDDGAFVSDIENASVSNVEEKLSFVMSGMWDVAANILNHPESGPREPVFDLYATSIRDNGGRSLTVEQMVELAKRLAHYSSNAHREVGRPNQVAIIKESGVISIEQPFFPELPRSLFTFSLIVNSHFNYSGVTFAHGWRAVFRCSWVGMQHELDGHYYIGNQFRDSVLMYDGGDVNLGDTNEVTGSVLLLGPHAILENEIVRRLTATFSSLQVAYAKPKPWQVVP